MKSMFLHDLKVACRSLLKYKLQTVISVVGLAVGLSVFVICNVKFRDELMRDRRLPHFESTYILAPKVFSYNSVNHRFAKDVKDKFPEIEKFVTFYDGWQSKKACLIGAEGGKKVLNEDFLYTDSAFMNFFDFKLLQGNWDVVKQQPDAVILTESAAIRLFGTIDVVGKTFMEVERFSERERECKIAGLMSNFPKQTQFENRAGLVLNTTYNEILRLRGDNHYGEERSFFRIRENVPIEDLNKKIESFLKTHPDESHYTSLNFHPIEKFRISSSKGAHLTFPLVMSGIGLLVLLTAIFNYVMFMSGRILNRQKEYGIRQITGANSKSIFRMFAMEITLSIFIVVFISLILIELLIRMKYGSYYISFDDKQNWLLILGGYLLEYIVLVWGVMFGICWLILKRFRILTTLQHIQGGGVRYKNRLSNLLLGLQLTICIILGGGAFFAYAQQEFMIELFRGKLSIEECKRIYEFGLGGNKFKTIREDFQNMINANPYIESYCRSGNNLLDHFSTSSNAFKMEGINNQSGEKAMVMIDHKFVDANYSEFINARMEEGRFFRADEPNCAVVNREFVRHFGINMLGKDITTSSFDHNTYHIVGIMENVLPVNRNDELQPCIYMPYIYKNNNLTYYVKLLPDAKPEVLDNLKAKMREQLHVSSSPWIKTLEEVVANPIKDIQAMSYMLLLFASICIIICLLGIYSSMMLAVEKRGREMAIRKINGARLVDIGRIFVRHYFVLLGVAALIAFPALYLGVQTFLESYTYRVSITPFPFIAIFALIFAIVLLTIASQLIKIMRINPVKKLKSE